jgi:hypothetical protein
MVVAFKVTPELEMQLPPSDSKVWVANRSRGGCHRLCAAVQVFSPPFGSDMKSLLIIGLELRNALGSAGAVRLAVGRSRLPAVR